MNRSNRIIESFPKNEASLSGVFFTRAFFAVGGCIVLLFILAFFLPVLMSVARYALLLMLVLVSADYIALFIAGKAPRALRKLMDRMSNGDENRVELLIENRLPFSVYIKVVDELPVQCQHRSWLRNVFLKGNSQQSVVYQLQPFERGVYSFGQILMYTSSRLGLLIRQSVSLAEKDVEVFPSFVQLRKYELLSQTSIQQETGSKRMRKIGHSMEFEQIKEYVRGDDVRTINWKATARRGALMINNYTDEKSQQVYCLIDKGRLMKMPFNQLSLLDYAINATLVLSNVCLQRQDRVGLMTFSNKMDSLLAADRKPTQQASILQVLYNQTTQFQETDFEMLYLQVRSRIKQRSLLVLFTNFESLSGLKRQIPYLRSISRHHLLMVVFFENTELTSITETPAKNLEDVYRKTIAAKFAHEKRLIVKELRSHGILSVLTAPEHLTVNAINKYLELKARQAS